MLAAWVLAASLAGAGTPADDERSPRAGEAYMGTAFGHPIRVAARDRRRVTAITLGVQTIPSGPSRQSVSPAGGLFLWRNPEDGRTRLRAELAGVYDDVRYERRIAGSRLDTVWTFSNETLPWARSVYVGGRRLAAEDLEWGEVRAGVGFGWRSTLSRELQDNAAEIVLTYEPGYLYFGRADDTGVQLRIPRNTYEGRLHLRARADVLERNLLELPHRGFAAGLDAWTARRARWEDWGPAVLANGRAGREWRAIRLYGLAAFGLPIAGAHERHRVVVSGYAGTGRHLDRFSGLRLSGGSNAGDWEAVSRPVLGAAGLDEIVSTGYVLANVEYRYEALFFLFLSGRGTVGRVTRPVVENGAARNRDRRADAVSLGVTSGFLWSSVLEISATRNFGLARAGHSTRTAFFFSWTKTF